MWMWMISAVLAAETLAPGVELHEVRHKEGEYRVVTVDLGHARVDLIGQADSIGTTPVVARARVEREGRTVVMLTNAGMYHSDRSPVGMHVERGQSHRGPVLGASSGNFGLLPNGVFVVDASGAQVMDTTKVAAVDADTWLATQSGPALVLDGQLHPKFNPSSHSFKLRSGVGVVDSTHVVFAISEDAVRFHDFATLFRDRFGCTDALFLDGTISTLWTSDTAKKPATQRYSGVLVVSVPAAQDGEDAKR